jgi:hypothetical protein
MPELLAYVVPSQPSRGHATKIVQISRQVNTGLISLATAHDQLASESLCFFGVIVFLYIEHALLVNVRMCQRLSEA